MLMFLLTLVITPTRQDPVFLNRTNPLSLGVVYTPIWSSGPLFGGKVAIGSTNSSFTGNINITIQFAQNVSILGANAATTQNLTDGSFGFSVFGNAQVIASKALTEVRFDGRINDDNLTNSPAILLVSITIDNVTYIGEPTINQTDIASSEPPAFLDNTSQTPRPPLSASTRLVSIVCGVVIGVAVLTVLIFLVVRHIQRKTSSAGSNSYSHGI